MTVCWAQAPVHSLALHLARVIERAKVGLDLARRLIDIIRDMPAGGAFGPERPIAAGDVLDSVVGRLPDGSLDAIVGPMIPLLDTTLLTNAPGEPRVGNQIQSEIRSADRIDVVMAFIRYSGISPLLEVLRRHCRDGRPLRVLTTTFTGSAEARALDALADLGAEIRVSYDTSSTRLHAKAWLFHRKSGFSTAYIGSSNLTHSAQISGLEWNVRVSGARNPDVIDKVSAVFESYWQNPDFEAYERESFLRDRTAVEFSSVIRFGRNHMAYPAARVLYVPNEAWNKMEVQMKHRLPGSGADIDTDVIAVGSMYWVNDRFCGIAKREERGLLHFGCVKPT